MTNSLGDKYYRFVDGHNLESRPILKTFYVVKLTPAGVKVGNHPQDDPTHAHQIYNGAQKKFAYKTIGAAKNSYYFRKRWHVKYTQRAYERATAMLAFAEADEYQTFGVTQ